MGKKAGKYIEIDREVIFSYISKRDERSITLTEIANFVGCSSTALSIFESGATKKIHEDILSGYTDYIDNFEDRRREMMKVEQPENSIKIKEDVKEAVQEIPDPTPTVVETAITKTKKPQKTSGNRKQGVKIDKKTISFVDVYKLPVGTAVRNTQTSETFIFDGEGLVKISLEETTKEVTVKYSVEVTKSIATAEYEVVSKAIKATKAFETIAKGDKNLYAMSGDDIFGVSMDSNIQLNELKDYKFFTIAS